MIISEKQIMQLMRHCKNFQAYLSAGDMRSEEKEYFATIGNLLCQISEQQPEELKDYANE